MISLLPFWFVVRKREIVSREENKIPKTQLVHEVDISPLEEMGPNYIYHKLQENGIERLRSKIEA